MKQKYENFFKKSPSPVPMKAMEFFDENVKDAVLYIKNSKGLSWEKYDELLNKYKDNCEVKIAILRDEDAPIGILDKILDNELSSTNKSKFVLFECLKHYIPSVSKIDTIINVVGEEMIEQELKDAFNNNRKPVFHKEVILDLQMHFTDKFSGYQFCHGFVPGSILSRLNYDVKTNEQILTGICNNENMSEKDRNRIFDMGCDFYSISKYTPYMINEIYKSCADTVFDIPLYTNELKDTAYKASEKIIEFIKEDKLSTGTLIDLANRVMNCKNTYNVPYASRVCRGIGIHCKDPEVLEKVAFFAVDAMYNPHLPPSILNKKTEVIVNGWLDGRMADAGIKKSINDFVPKINFNAQLLLRVVKNTPPNVFQELTQYANVPYIILRAIQKENIDDRSKVLCGMNMTIKSMGLDEKKQKYIMDFLASKKMINCFDITSDADVGIPLTTEEYKNLHSALKQQIESISNKNTVKEFNLKLEELEAGYEFRDLSVDFPNYYISVKDLDFRTKATEHSITPKPWLSDDEINNLLHSATSENTLIVPRDEIFYAIDSISDRVLFYETIDNFINTVDAIDSEVEKLKEREKENNIER